LNRREFYGSLLHVYHSGLQLPDGDTQVQQGGKYLVFHANILLQKVLKLKSPWGLTVGFRCDSIAIMGEKNRDTDGQYELEQAARELGIGIATLYRWMRNGSIVPIRIYRRTFIPKSEVERLKKKAMAAKP